MNKAETITKKVMKTLEAMKTERLLDLWEQTETMNDENTPTVRGWIMDEIEKRNPEAFNEWLEGDAEDASLRKYILA